MSDESLHRMSEVRNDRNSERTMDLKKLIIYHHFILYKEKFMPEKPEEVTLNYQEEKKSFIPMITRQELSPGFHQSQEVMKS